MTDIKATLKQRGGTYGPMEQNAELTQTLMKAVLRSPGADKLKDMHKETIHMIFFKISRIVNGDEMYADNAHDIAGYATLLEEWIKEENNDA